ncbi:hypothetical protein Clacol_002232 [Clathrus columnatus]|uniref:Uncharacterized protein n=1 Tax=Clathrus columnatus TaxID=1419009 RepID=A0AAV5A186_9AGAM|nr:hypothetical protein Clacol_002232 [Clathrus columnatus]
MLRSSIQRSRRLSSSTAAALRQQIHSTSYRSAMGKASVSYTYTKQTEHHHEPDVSPNTGKRMYVVSPKENVDHDVPGGPYPTADPYVMPPATEPPSNTNAQMSSTSPGPAHPNTTSRVPQNPGGVGESSAVRYRSAPGAMAEGSNGGLSLMDESTTIGTNRLADRNPPPPSGSK